MRRYSRCLGWQHTAGAIVGKLNNVNETRSQCFVSMVYVASRWEYWPKGNEATRDRKIVAGTGQCGPTVISTRKHARVRGPSESAVGLRVTFASTQFGTRLGESCGDAFTIMRLSYCARTDNIRRRPLRCTTRKCLPSASSADGSQSHDGSMSENSVKSAFPST